MEWTYVWDGDSALDPQPIQTASTPQAPPSAPEEKSRFAQLAETAEDAKTFRIEGQDKWALFQPGTTDCAMDSSSPARKLDQPDTEDEFERRRLLANRKAIADGYVGKLIRFEGGGSLAGVKSITLGKPYNPDYRLALSTYDFIGKQYNATLRADSSSAWPVGGTSPVFSTQSFTFEDEHEVAKLGGKSLSVKRRSTDAIYQNNSRIVIPIKVPVEEAESWKNNANVSIVVLMRLLGLGFHKACKQECSTILGMYGCSTLNTGVGEYYRASLIGYEIKVNGKIVAEKTPPPTK